jgi:hypothetical protein
MTKIEVLYKCKFSPESRLVIMNCISSLAFSIVSELDLPNKELSLSRPMICFRFWLFLRDLRNFIAALFALHTMILMLVGQDFFDFEVRASNAFLISGLVKLLLPKAVCTYLLGFSGVLKFVSGLFPPLLVGGASFGILRSREWV